MGIFSIVCYLVGLVVVSVIGLFAFAFLVSALIIGAKHIIELFRE